MRTLSRHDRVIAYGRSVYARKWPDSQPYVSPSGRWVYGHWFIGNLHSNTTRYPGAYPRTYLGRVLALFPDVRPREILHVFSGGVRRGPWTRVDVNPTRRAEVTGCAYDLAALLAARPRLGPFRLILADPPYLGQAQKLYQTREVESWRAFQAFAAVLAPGGHVVWLDTRTPQYRLEHWENWGSILVRRSTNNAIREASFFERRAA